MFSLGVMFVCLNAYDNNLKASVFKANNYYIFSALYNKPYTKFAPHCVGVMSAYLYQQIVYYRKETIVDK
jgi:hypothetical protein